MGPTIDEPVSLKRLSAADVARGMAFAWVVMSFIDIITGLPIIHLSAVALFIAVVFECYSKKMFSHIESLLFVIASSVVFITLITIFASSSITFVADAVLLGHAAIQVDSPVDSSVTFVVCGTLVLFNYCATLWLRYFPALIWRISVALSASIGISFLLCFHLGSDYSLDDWIEAENIIHVKSANIGQSEVSKKSCMSPIVVKPVDPPNTASNTVLLPREPRRLSSKDIDITSSPTSEPRRLLSQIDATSSPTREPRRLLSQIDATSSPTLAPRRSQSQRNDIIKPEAEMITSPTATSPQGFLEKFAAHKAEMAFLEAKGRLIRGALLTKHTNGSTRERFVRLNPVSCCVEWWLPDSSSLVGQTPVSSLLSVSCSGISDSSFQLVFSSRTVVFDAPTPEQSIQWLCDTALLLQHKHLF